MSEVMEKHFFTVPLSFEAHAIAKDSCQQQPDLQKAKQIYLNTLAIYAVEFYLRCLGFDTNWCQSDSRNPLMLKFMDIADLDIDGIGKLECRFVLPKAEVCHIPTDVIWEERIGYVVVQLQKSLKEATLLGFTETAAPELPLNQLQPLQKLIDILSKKKQSAPINLRQWFAGTIEAGWQTMEQLLNLQQVELAFMFRDAVNIARGQQINLGMELGEQSVALIVMLPPAPDTEVDIRVQVHPLGGEIYLPSGVKLIVSNEAGEQVLDTESREADNFIQLHFSAELEEKFSVTVACGETNVTQEFCL